MEKTQEAGPQGEESEAEEEAQMQKRAENMDRELATLFHLMRKVSTQCAESRPPSPPSSSQPRLCLHPGLLSLPPCSQAEG